MPKLSDVQKAEQRQRAALAAVGGIPTAALVKIAALGDATARLATLAAEARKRAQV